MVLGTEQGAYQQRKEMKQTIARAMSGHTGNRAMVCRLREGREGVRSRLEGKGKGERLQQETGMWEGPEDPEAWQPEELRAVLPGFSLAEVAQGSWEPAAEAWAPQ